MANQQSNQPSYKAGLATGFLLMVGMVFVAFVAAWFARREEVTILLLKYAYFLTYVPAWISLKLGLSVDSFFIRLIYDINAASRTFPPAIDVLTLVNKASYVLLPLMAIGVFAAYKANINIINKLEALHDYWSLMKTQSLTNPCIVPVVRFTEYWRKHNIQRPDNLARALTPDEFAAKHQLIHDNGGGLLIDYDKCVAVFTKQIGNRINYNKLPIHYKALAAVFMTRIVYRGEKGRSKAKQMLDQINISCDPSKASGNNYALAFDFSEAASEFDKHINHPDVDQIAEYFVHETTFLMALLSEARKDGKLAPAEFIWLKLVDRPLWYALYGVSKSLIAKGYVEGAGPFGQYWAAQTAMKNKYVLAEPYMHNVVVAFEKRLFEANAVAERQHMPQKEREREKEFGRIPEI